MALACLRPALPGCCWAGVARVSRVSTRLPRSSRAARSAHQHQEFYSTASLSFLLARRRASQAAPRQSICNCSAIESAYPEGVINDTACSSQRFLKDFLPVSDRQIFDDPFGHGPWSEARTYGTALPHTHLNPKHCEARTFLWKVCPLVKSEAL